MAEEYNQKRDFSRTPEPPLTIHSGGEGALKFTIHKHRATRLHYDLRLELNGVLKCWAVPAGPSLNPSVKRLAVMVEDHPFDYRTFEGVIPEGEYGAGEVIVWDEGTYSPEAEGRLFFDDRKQAQEVSAKSLAGGKLSVSLKGHRLKGLWTLVQLRGKGKDWLLIKRKDEFADVSRDILTENTSVVSGLSLDQL